MCKTIKVLSVHTDDDSTRSVQNSWSVPLEFAKFSYNVNKLKFKVQTFKTLQVSMKQYNNCNRTTKISKLLAIDYILKVDKIVKLRVIDIKTAR